MCSPCWARYSSFKIVYVESSLYQFLSNFSQNLPHLNFNLVVGLMSYSFYK